LGSTPRSVSRGTKCASWWSGADRIETALADFASLAAVRRLAETLAAGHDRIDVLVNNAGLISPRFQLSENGYELTFAVNHLAPFLLTNLLLERLRGSAPARIVTVASQTHRGASLAPSELIRPRDWTPLSAYSRSKACNILFTRALARRLDAKEVTATCLHPGVVATAIGDRAGALAGLGWRLAKPFLIGPEKGAATSLFLATVADPTPFHGAYVIGNRIAEPDTAARDDRLGEQLWMESARLVGL
jgi:NAD(P)-dependent dehydrogenase (short-subunit alcohol dehydrogenase family)